MPLKVLLHLQYDQHFSSTSMPIIRSSKLYVCYYRLWCVYADCEFNPQSAYAHHILHNQHEYSTMNNLMTLLKPLNNLNTLTPHEQFHIQALHRKGRLIPEQYPGDPNPVFQLVIHSATIHHMTEPVEKHPSSQTHSLLCT